MFQFPENKKIIGNIPPQKCIVVNIINA